VNHGQNWKGWERSGEKGLIIKLKKKAKRKKIKN
jgi:hypothetical protein